MADLSSYVRIFGCLHLAACLLPLTGVAGQENGRATLPIQIYHELREPVLDQERTARVKEFMLERDGARFEFQDGRFYFLKPVQNRVTGAVFLGEGVFFFAPPTELERRQLARLAGTEALRASFDELYLRFTDGTFDELAAQLDFEPALSSNADDVLHRHVQRTREVHNFNLEARLLADLTGSANEFFRAELKSDRRLELVYQIDSALPEPVRLFRIEDRELHWWSGFDLQRPVKNGDVQARELIDTDQVTLNVRVDRGAKLDVEADLEFLAQGDGDRMLELALTPSLRVSKVTLDGRELDFIQEDPKKDADFWIQMPEPLKRNQRYRLTVHYSGDEVIERSGGGNFFVGERTRWYPSIRRSGDPTITGRSHFRMRFFVPRRHTLVATGDLVRRGREGDSEFSEWETSVPVMVAGFNYGIFRQTERKDDPFLIQVYTNEGIQSELREVQHFLERYPEIARDLGIIGRFSTSRLAENTAIDTGNALRVFSHYFGEIPFKSVSISQQPSGVFGQAWPGLIFLPYTAFFDSFQRHEFLRLSGAIGARRSWTQFLDAVGPHEIAHQWWGHAVGWRDQTDQWISEGFASFSAGLFLQYVRGFDSYEKYMENERDRILQKLPNGRRLNDAGPIILNMRLNSKDIPFGRQIIYPKGHFVLHMIRMMLYDFAEGSDDRFVALMRDFVRTHYLANATTRSFQEVVERHVGGSMDWFFDQWVYGTEIPAYRLIHEIVPQEDGQYLFSGRIVQENVSETFAMPVPIRIHFASGSAVVRILVQGSESPFKVTIPEKPTEVEFNPFMSVLCE